MATALRAMGIAMSRCHCWVLCLVSIAQSSDAMAGQGVACNVRIIALCYILALLLGAFSATAECHV